MSIKDFVTNYGLSFMAWAFIFVGFFTILSYRNSKAEEWLSNELLIAYKKLDAIIDGLTCNGGAIELLHSRKKSTSGYSTDEFKFEQLCRPIQTADSKKQRYIKLTIYFHQKKHLSMIIESKILETSDAKKWLEVDKERYIEIFGEPKGVGEY